MKSRTRKPSGSKTIQSGPATTNETISIRKIENGYIVSRSTSGRDFYKQTEKFSPKKPKIDV